MTVIDAPAGNWASAAAAEFAPVDLTRGPLWLTPCQVADCNGEPHPGRPAKHARPKQIAPLGDWFIWLLMSGRGWGKTRTGAENFLAQILELPLADGKPTEWAIVAETFSDCRKICVQGPSGLLWVLRDRNIEHTYNRSNWQIILATGQVIHMLGADNADAGRGLNLSGAWLDELAKWPKPADTWEQGLVHALRIGPRPRVIATTTPKTIMLLREWLARTDGSVIVTRGSTFENAANLSPAALAELRHRFEGTRLGRQELEGELLEDVEGALWTLDNIAADRIVLTDGKPARPLPDFRRVIVAVDPSGGDGAGNDEQGIVVAAIDADGHAYVLADRSCKLTPEGWASRAVAAFREFKGDRLVAEPNFGGAMVESTIRSVDKTIPVKMVPASRGKQQRAEPIASLYEQHKVHHVGVFTELENQMTTWDTKSGWSPDRMDALVWALTELMLGYQTPQAIQPLTTTRRPGWEM